MQVSSELPPITISPTTSVQMSETPMKTINTLLKITTNPTIHSDVSSKINPSIDNKNILIGIIAIIIICYIICAFSSLLSSAMNMTSNKF